MPNETLLDSISIHSIGLTDRNALWIEVNPINSPFHQSEEFHFNNLARIPFQVSKDITNPFLDITFDGIHILNGDIVSPSPDILISLKDENKFLALNDTANFIVSLKKPGSNLYSQIYFSNDLLFTPAQLPQNSCKIEYSPEKLDDGVYELSVQAKDRSNNNSGSNEYKIQFEVINKSTITEILNYPNPFSTSTRFVFTLTGSEIPETFKIQIMTVSGKVVKEIEKEELGEIRIGKNISSYAWDGKDEFGDPLGNGVYLYKVQTRIHGNEIEKRNTKANEYFKKGWGKMVIMR
jgi:flagellar hook assembly protein FlgD